MLLINGEPPGVSELKQIFDTKVLLLILSFIYNNVNNNSQYKIMLTEHYNLIWSFINKSILLKLL